MNKIDINCDVGEINQLYSNGVYGKLMDHVTSINIACGGHAGNKKLMRSMIQLAKRKNIHIGAHPSYPDKINFGRKKLNIKGTELFTIVDIEKGINPRAEVNCEIKYVDGSSKTIKVLSRIDTENEIEYYKNGGILQFVLRNMLN